jgi:YVTN family beta-propeller protein
MRNFALPARGLSLAIAVPCLIGLWAVSASAQSVITTIPESVTPGAVVTDPATGYAYVPLLYVNGNTGEIQVIDEGNQQIVRTFDVGEDPQSIAVNFVTSRLYTVDPATGNVYVVDLNSYQIIATIPLAGDWIAVNPATNLIYVSNFQNTVYVLDGKTNQQIATVTVLSAQYLAVNPKTNRIYVATGDPDEGIVTVIDGNTNTVVTNIDIPGPSNSTQTIAVDPIRNLVYAVDIANGNNSLGAGGAVAVIDGASNSVVTTVDISGEPYGIAVDPVAQRIYVSNASLNEVQIIDGADNQLLSTTVPTGAEPYSLGIDFYNHLLYSSNFGDYAESIGPSVTVISTSTQQN